jgi:hypothetical protein
MENSQIRYLEMEKALEIDTDFGKEPVITDITVPQQIPPSYHQYGNLFDQAQVPPNHFQILEDLHGAEINKYILENHDFFMNALLSYLMPQENPPYIEDYESVVSKLKVNNLIAWQILNNNYLAFAQKQKQQDRRTYLLANPPSYMPQAATQTAYGGKAKKTTSKSKK